MERIYGLENLIGLGYLWNCGEIFYAIGLKDGDIPDFNFEIDLPDCGWVTVIGKTENLKDIYDEIYKSGALKYETEEFYNNGSCKIKYTR